LRKVRRGEDLSSSLSKYFLFFPFEKGCAKKNPWFLFKQGLHQNTQSSILVVSVLLHASYLMLYFDSLYFRCCFSCGLMPSHVQIVLSQLCDNLTRSQHFSSPFLVYWYDCVGCHAVHIRAPHLPDLDTPGQKCRIVHPREVKYPSAKVRRLRVMQKSVFSVGRFDTDKRTGRAGVSLFWLNVTLRSKLSISVSRKAIVDLSLL
jgi:hypothetical protein